MGKSFRNLFRGTVSIVQLQRVHDEQVDEKTRRIFRSRRDARDDWVVDGEEWIEANRRTKVGSASRESVSVSHALSGRIHHIHRDGVDDIERHESSLAGAVTHGYSSLISATKQLRKAAHPLAGLINLTAISGAYVAGMDAGRAYNTFPLMNGKIVPDEYLKDWESKGWRNFFENTAAVQFNHQSVSVDDAG